MLIAFYLYHFDIWYKFKNSTYETKRLGRQFLRWSTSGPSFVNTLNSKEVFQTCSYFDAKLCALAISPSPCCDCSRKPDYLAIKMTGLSGSSDVPSQYFSFKILTNTPFHLINVFCEWNRLILRWTLFQYQWPIFFLCFHVNLLTKRTNVWFRR